MGVVRKVVAAVLVLALCAAMMAIPASASQMFQDGLRVELTTDRETYAPGDTVSTTLTVTNTGSEPVLDLILEILIPEGCSLLANQRTQLQDQSLEPGEVLSLTVQFTTSQACTAASILPELAPMNVNTAGVNSLRGCVPGVVDTTARESAERVGAEMHDWIPGLCAVAIVLVMASGIWYFGRRFVSMIVCMALIVSMFASVPVQVSAAEARPCTIETETAISVDGQTMIVRGRVGYRLSGGSGVGRPLELEADEIYFVAGSPANVTFTVTVSRLASQIGLFCGSEQVGTLNDDGTAGDAVAGDGVYSCTIRVENSGTEPEVYHAKAGRLTSNDVTLYYFAPLNEQTAAQARAAYQSVNRALQEIEAAYADESGFIAPSQAGAVMEQVSNYLAQYSNSGDILLYEVDATGAYIKLTSGLTLMYAPALEGVSAGGSDVSLTFAIYQPHPDVAIAQLEEWVGTLAEEYDTDSQTFSGTAVTLDRVKALGPDQVILWNGHGGYGPVIKSFLASGEYFDWDAWWWDTTGYFWDCVQDRIINRSTETQSDLACITHKFVTHYCGDLSDDLIILSACHSGQDEKLAKAFISKGAKTVVGFSDTVYTAYGANMCKLITGYMTLPNADTNNFYTVSEAVEKAKTVLGENDLVYARRYPEIFTDLKSNAARPVVFGRGDYRYRNGQMGNLIGKICDATDRTTPIANASVCVGWDGYAEWSATTDAQGEYTIALPEETYPVVVSAPGYLDFVDYATVTGNQNTYLETYLMIAQSDITEGTAMGCIANSLTGVGIAGVQIEVREGWNNDSVGDVLTTATTDEGGQYSVVLPLGNYTLNLKKDDFIDAMVNIVVVGGTYGPQNGTMTPCMNGEDYRIVLSWDADPRDLDSHLVGTKSSGGEFHVYYASKVYREGSESVCVLDVDDTSGYGPETVTLKAEGASDCYYYIHRYAGNGTVAGSGAQVRVFQGEEQIAVFNVPTDQGVGNYWNVFSIVDGQLIVHNTITSLPVDY